MNENAIRYKQYSLEPKNLLLLSTVTIGKIVMEAGKRGLASCRSGLAQARETTVVVGENEEALPSPVSFLPPILLLH